MKAFIYICLAVSFFLGCQQGGTVPPQLIGMWKTDEPKYADRYVEFTEELLIFGTGGGAATLNQIEKVDKDNEGFGTAYTVHYKDSEGGKWSLSLVYYPKGTIELKNRKGVWKKAVYEGN